MAAPTGVLEAFFTISTGTSGVLRHQRSIDIAIELCASNRNHRKSDVRPITIGALPALFISEGILIYTAVLQPC